jgi:sugar phosphate isomerase/epimerase
MQFAYMVATPEVTEPRVTAWRGDLERAFAAVASAGFTGVELMIREAEIQDSNRLAQLAADNNLQIPVLCTGEIYGQDGLSLSDPNPFFRKQAIRRLKSMVELAAEFGAHVNVGRLRGRYVEGVSSEQTLDWIGQGLKAAAEVNPSVRILLEPISRFVTNCVLTTADGLAFIEQLNIPNVNLMLDTMHMEMQGENVSEWLTRAAAQCYHIHVGQADRLPLGTGDYDLTPIYTTLQKLHYQHWVGVEVWQEPDQETALRLSANTLANIVNSYR